MKGRPGGWSRSLRAACCALAALWGAAAAAVGEGATDDEALVSKARAIHARVLALDSHVDIPFAFGEGPFDPGRPSEMQVDLPKMTAGGLDAVFWIVYVAQGPRTAEGYAKAKADALRKFRAIHRVTDELHPDRFGLALRAEDVPQIRASGRRVVLVGIENGYVIGRDLTFLRDYYALGARYMTLAHNGHNAIADSAQPSERLGDGEAEHGGLSSFGREVVREMNRLGMLVDVSHVSRAAAVEAVRLSRAPVIASHSGAAAVRPHPRNLDDEAMRLIARTGGVIQLVAYDSFVKERSEARQEALDTLDAAFGLDDPGRSREDLPAEARRTFAERLAVIDEVRPPSTVADFVDHIDHAVHIAGIDHVGIASDFGGGGGISGWSDAGETFNITIELVRRGYTEDEIAKIWGGNLLRALAGAERVAREIRAAE